MRSWIAATVIVVAAVACGDALVPGGETVALDVWEEVALAEAGSRHKK